MDLWPQDVILEKVAKNGHRSTEYTHINYKVLADNKLEKEV